MRDHRDRTKSSNARSLRAALSVGHARKEFLNKSEDFNEESHLANGTRWKREQNYHPTLSRSSLSIPLSLSSSQYEHTDACLLTPSKTH